MSNILLYKMNTESMKADKFSDIGRHFEMKGEVVETEEALAIHDSNQALAYAQPRGKFAGLLFYLDQSIGQAEPVDKAIDPKSAESWANNFLDSYSLFPRKEKDKKIQSSVEIFGYEDQSFSYDGKERRKLNLKTEIGSKIQINGIPVVGPRATVRMVFKGQGKPISIHRGLWESIEILEERELVREHDIYTIVKEKLNSRRECRAYYDVVDCRMAYFAQEFCGGPDILAPYYFLEIEYDVINNEKIGVTQGPTQILTLPAYR